MASTRDYVFEVCLVFLSFADCAYIAILNAAALSGIIAGQAIAAGTQQHVNS